MSAVPEPRRLTPTEQRLLAEQRAHEVTLAFATRAPAPPEHSVEISRNARGIMQYAVTVRGYNLDNVADSAKRIHEALNAAMPYPETNGGTE